MRNGAVAVKGRQRKGGCSVVVIVTNRAGALTPCPREKGVTALLSSLKDGDKKDNAGPPWGSRWPQHTVSVGKGIGKYNGREGKKSGA